MRKFLVVMLLGVVLYGLYNTLSQKAPATAQVQTKSSPSPASYRLALLERELAQIDSPRYLLSYITEVIDHGSDSLGFGEEGMAGGFAAPQDAPKIACYVLTLSGKTPPHPCAPQAQMFFTSICGGCHGREGRGIPGKFPDLTRKKLLGIAKKEAWLKREIARLKQTGENRIK